MTEFEEWILESLMEGGSVGTEYKSYTFEDLDMACQISAADFVHGIIDANSQDDVQRLVDEYTKEFRKSSVELVQRISGDVKTEMDTQAAIDKHETNKMFEEIRNDT